MLESSPRDDWSEVNVPGKITKPASRIQVKNAAKMLCNRGIVSSARSMSIYRVCAVFCLLGGPGLAGGEGVRCVPFSEAVGCDLWNGR